ncbi:RNA polymerase sigma factor [Anaerostipes sp.]|uniref:RNA polymerase sigma factor n=1 Tax=Anaerostipes sp. TaxID=1872530 RepID=UPI0025C3D591|nr:RNA polymerase sigma factor [Anaerostipes sp.]MBS7007244.1 RNA polymerase sigma factor [Anaerostipes sp.]
MERENIYEKLCPFVERAKGGDEQAFEHLYHATYEMTRVFVTNFCNNYSEVDDVIQEIYLEVYRFLPSLKDNMAFYAWHRQIVYHCCLKYVRRQKETSIGDEKVEHIKNLLDQSEQPQDIVLKDEKKHILHECIQRLPEKQRAAIILNVLQQLKMKEVGEILGCNENAVKNLLYHGRKNLKKQVESLPAEDREALGLRSFGFFSLYPVLRSSLAGMGKTDSAKHLLLAKKILAGTLAVTGAGAAGMILMKDKPLPSRNFVSVQTPEVKLEAEVLKGIKIPKPKPVQKKRINPVYMKVLKEDKKLKRLTAHVQGDVDYRNTYIETENGNRIFMTGYDPENQVIYFPVQKKNFILHLTDTEGKQRIYRLTRMKK